MDINALGLGAAIPNFGAPTLDGLQFEPTQNAGVLQLKGTGRQMVKFYTKEFYDMFATEKAGAEAKAKGIKDPVVPVYIKKEMVHIVTPGDKTEYDGPAEDYHKRAYFQQYSRFKEGKGMNLGTPLADAEFLHGPEITELAYHQVHTIEQLADAGDLLCETMPRGYDIREHARAWCKITHGNQLQNATKRLSADLNEARKIIIEMSESNKKRDEEMAELRAMLQGARNTVTVDEAVVSMAARPSVEAPKKPRGRPRKVTPEAMEL